LRKLSLYTRFIFDRLIPEQYRSSPERTLTLLKWFLLGLLIRLTLMPFAAHADLLAIYWRAHDIVYHHNLTRAAINVGAHFIHAFFLYIFTPLMPYYEQIWTHPWWWGAKSWESPLVWQTFFKFCNHQNIFRTLFLLKFPYLLFDIACAILLLYLFKKVPQGLRAFKFWMVNPICIFGTYIFGRYGVLVAFFIFLFLYLLQRERLCLAMIILGLSVTIRAFPLLFIIPFAFMFGQTILSRMKIVTWALSPLIVLAVAYRLFIGYFGEISTWLKMPETRYFYSMSFFLGYHDYLYIFVVCYTLILIYCFYFSKGRFVDAWGYPLLILLLFFSISRFHPQYLSWLTFFLVFAIAEDIKYLKLHLIQIVCFVVYTFQWGRALAGYLLCPIHPSFFASLLSPSEIISRFYPIDNFIGIFRSVFTAVSIWMMYLVFMSLKKSQGTEIRIGTSISINEVNS